jgi:uncharacterized membrane protein
MAIKLRYQSPTGETRPWTLKEIIQGKPVDRPTHPMFVHFPIAFWIGALWIDVISRLGRFPSAPLMATWLILGGFIGFAAAATTGLADRSTMRPGSRIRKLASQHMLVQYTATALFVIDFAVRWSHRHDAHSSALWIVLDVVGVLVVTFGADLGGQLVFKRGFRVGPGED